MSAAADLHLVEGVLDRLHLWLQFVAGRAAQRREVVLHVADRRRDTVGPLSDHIDVLERINRLAQRLPIRADI